MASGNILELKDQSFESDVIRSEVPVLVDFWAPWCAPCRAIAPSVEALATQYGGQVKVGKMNIDDHPATAQRYNIRSIPTLLMFKDGAIVGQEIGGVNKGMIESLIKKAL